VIWANWSLDSIGHRYHVIIVGSAIYGNTFSLSWSEQTWQTCYLLVQMTIYSDNSYLSYIPRRRQESVIAKYSKYPHRCSDWLLHILFRTLDSSALQPCQSTTHASRRIPYTAAMAGFQAELATKRQNLQTATLNIFKKIYISLNILKCI